MSVKPPVARYAAPAPVAMTVIPLNNNTQNLSMMENNMQIPDQYLADICRLFDLSKVQSKLLKLLVSKASEGFILLDNFNRMQICSNLKIERQTLANYLNILCKKGILKLEQRNNYYLRREIFSHSNSVVFDQIIIYYLDGERVISGS